VSRFYDIVVTPAQTATSQSPAAFRHWTSLVNGQNDPGALDIELDFMSFANASSGNDGSTVTIHGVPLKDISQAYQFAGMNIAVKAGMSKGLPLADPSQQGLILNGEILQAWANWVGTQMDLNLLVYASTYTYDKPGNFVLDWKQGTDLKDALTTTLGVAYPDLGIVFSLSKPYILTRPVGHTHYTLAGLAALIASTTKTATFPGVLVSSPINNTILVSDGLTQRNPKTLNFKDLVGQPAWIDKATMIVTTVMRGDIQIGDFIQMPQGLLGLPGAMTIAASAVSGTTQLDFKSAFQGQFNVQEIRHVGNFRSPNGADWVTIFKCAPLQAVEGIMPAGYGG
jgi:hypothetical protein